VFVIVIQFRSSLIFAARVVAYVGGATGGKGRLQPCSEIFDVTESYEHPSLLRYGINYDRKKFYSSGLVERK
jgi:hypothetical protein